MTKRFAALVLCLAAGGVLVWFLTGRPPREGDIARLLPADTFLLLDMEKPVATVTNVSQSRLMRTIRGIDWPQVMGALDVPEEEIRLFTEKRDDLLGLLGNPLLHELIDQRLLLAAFPGKADNETGSDAASEHPQLLLVVKPKYNAAVLDKIIPTLAGKAGKIEVVNKAYQGFTVKRFVLEDGQVFHAAAHEGFLFIALQEKPIQHCLDLALEQLLQGQTGLAANTEYQRLRTAARGEEQIFFFLDVERLAPLLRDFSGQVLENSQQTEQEQFFANLGAVRGLALSMRQHGQRLASTTRIVMNPQGLNEVQQFMLQKKPQENTKLASMPAKQLLYFWTNWIDPSTWWQMTTKYLDAEDKEAVTQFSGWLKQHSGLNAEEMFALFGNEFGVQLAGMQTTGFFPTPRICLCLGMKEPEKVAAMLEKSLSGLPLDRQSMAGVEVVSIRIAGGLMQPAYALNGSTLMLADDRAQIESFLEPAENTLLRDPDVMALDMQFTAPSNAVTIIRAAELMEGVKELVSWGGAMVAIRGAAVGAQSKIVIDQVLMPLLDGMKMYRMVGSRSFLEGSDFVTKKSILLEADNVEQHGTNGQ